MSSQDSPGRWPQPTRSRRPRQRIAGALADVRKGFTVGTSLGGLGKKFAFVAYLQQADAAGVITALETEQSL
jgi:hypothetical protein